MGKETKKEEELTIAERYPDGYSIEWRKSEIELAEKLEKEKTNVKVTDRKI
tara:strand:- start:320 stop:472 length:153 start_codon:yes stop_codon:yes gene_type:complete